MTIDLGLYVKNYSTNKIGSFTIPNHSIEPVYFNLEDKNNDEIKIIKNKYIKNTKLNKLEDLVINFELDNSKNLKEDCYVLNYNLNLYKNEKDIIDTCNFNVIINIIPLIMEFSINNENFELENNSIIIKNPVPNLKISYKFPGDFKPNLGIKTSLENTGIKIDNSKNGSIEIKSNFNNGFDEIKYNSFLYLCDTQLFNVDVNYKKYINYGLILFDERRNIIIDEIDENKKFNILPEKGKKFYFFNMTGIKLKIETQIEKDNNKNDKLEIKCEKNEINSGEIIEFIIKNLKYEEAFITLNNYKIYFKKETFI